MAKYLFNFSIAFVLALFFLVGGKNKAHAEIIQEFRSSVKVAPDGVIKVVENFTIDFRDYKQRNQVIRYIQTRYRRGGSIHDVKVKLTKVSMDENPETYTVARKTGDEIQVHIGNKNEKLSKIHKFQLEYEVYRAVNFFRGKPELYFNATGHQWPFPMRDIKCLVTLPRGVDPGSVSAWSLIGAPGYYTNKKEDVQGNTIEFSASAIRSGKGLTIIVDLPPGSVILPSVLQDVIWYLQTGYQVFLLPLLTIVTLAGWWWLTGRNKFKVVQESGWRPPDYLSACEVGTLFDESCDLQDIVSMVVDLAARGFIQIRVLPYDGFLYLGNKDYELTLLKSVKDKELKPHEQVFLALLFGLSSKTYISSLRGQFEEHLPVVRRNVYESLVRGGFFTRDPELDKKNFIAVGAVVITVGVSLLGNSVYHMTGVSTAVGIIISGLIIILGSRSMPTVSRLGKKAIGQSIGFRDFLARAGSKTVENTIKEEPENFSKYLSYAIVLGVADKWALLYKDVVKDYPQWYQIDESLRSKGFSSIDFVRELGDGIEVINRVLTEKESPFGSLSQSRLNEIKVHK